MIDRVTRSYAHTALYGTDPLQGLDPAARRAILMMPSTFRERWKLAPWRTRDSRRHYIAEIIAERRLLYELANTKAAEIPETPALPQPLNPYYQHRASVLIAQRMRASQDAHDLEHDPRAQTIAVTDPARARLLQIQIARARLDLEELEMLAANLNPQAPKRTSPFNLPTLASPTERER